MKKAILVIFFFIVYWLLLPATLIKTSAYLDRTLFIGYQLPAKAQIAGFFLSVPGFILMLLTVYQFRKFSDEFPVSATPPPKIIQRGLFAVWRHPIYLFASVTLTGLALIERSYGFLLVVLPAYYSLLALYIFFEEKMLIRRFGRPYEIYRNRTPLVIPRLYNLLRFIASPLFRILFKIKIVNRGNMPPAPPFFIVAGHRNYLDPFFICYAVPWPVRFLTTFEMFRKSTTARLFTKLGAIPKKRYTSDPAAIREMINSLDKGYPVGIFPEGERSWTGVLNSFKPGSTAMMRKFSNIPILPVKIEGNYFLWPRWSPRMMKSDIQVTLQPVINSSDYPDDASLEMAIRQCIDTDYPANDPNICRSRILTGRLSQVIYRCPSCGEFESLAEMPDNTIRCTKCSLAIQIDNRFSLLVQHDNESTKHSVFSLYNKIRINEAELVNEIPFQHSGNDIETLNGEKIFFKSRGTLETVEDRRFRMLGTGTLRLTENGILFLNENIKVSLTLSLITAVTIESYYRLQIFISSIKMLYQIILGEESVIKWQDTIILLMKIKGLKTPLSR